MQYLSVRQGVVNIGSKESPENGSKESPENRCTSVVRCERRRGERLPRTRRTNVALSQLHGQQQANDLLQQLIVMLML